MTGVGSPGRHQVEHLALPVGQRGERLGRNTFDPQSRKARTRAAALRPRRRASPAADTAPAAPADLLLAGSLEQVAQSTRPG